MSNILRTKEAIVDPVAFVREDPAYFDLATGDYLTVLSPTYDVLVAGRGVPRSTERAFDLGGSVSKPLGSHFMYGQQGNVAIGSGRVDVSWYTSPEELNALSSQLGLQPGVDVFKLTHSPGNDELTLREYLKHIARGELPLATELWHGEDRSTSFFDHDRAIHAPGVLMIPPEVTARIIEIAKRSDSDTASRRTSQIDLADNIDGLTGFVTFDTYNESRTFLEKMLKKLVRNGTLDHRWNSASDEFLNRYISLKGWGLMQDVWDLDREIDVSDQKDSIRIEAATWILELLSRLKGLDTKQ